MLGRHFLLYFFMAGFAIAQPAGTGVISGVVVDNSTGDGVRKAIVTVTWHGQPRSWATARTGSDGRFRFERLPAGNYDLTARKAGVGTATYGADRIGETGELIPLADGQARDGLVLRFVHAASISGRVVDSEGEPLSSSNVALYGVGRNLGERILVRAGGAQTNDRGEFRLSNVQPGKYYLSASGSQECCNLTMVVDSGYFGDKSDWKESAVVSVRDGEAVTGIDFHLSRQATVRLHGHIRGLPPPDPPPAQRGIVKTLVIDGPAGITGDQVFVSRIDSVNPFNMTIAVTPEREFDYRNFPAGRYRIEARSNIGKKLYAGSQVIDLQPGTGDIELTVAPAADLKGVLGIEGGTVGQVPAVQVTLAGGQRFRNVIAHPGADGSFTLEQVPPGEWELNLNPMPRGSFLKSVMLGDKDVRFQKLAIESGSDATLTIVLSMNSASIHGQVDGRAAILLAPMGKFHDLARFYYAMGTDDDGRFQMKGIAPGRYKIFALERMAAANYRNPEAVDALDALTEGAAEEIELTEGASVEVHPKLISVERLREVLP